MWLGTVVLLARRPLDANPDALHPGKAGEQSAGESLLSPSDFPGLSWARSPKLSVTPAQHAEHLGLLQSCSIARSGSRASGPGAGLGARSPQRNPLFVI